MGYFKDNTIERVVLPSDPNYYVDIQTNLTWGDIKKLGEVDSTGTVNFETTGDRFLLMVITSWNLDNEDGTIADINSTNIDRLQRDDVMLIIEKASGSVADVNTKKNSIEQSTPTTVAQG